MPAAARRNISLWLRTKGDADLDTATITGASAPHLGLLHEVLRIKATSPRTLFASAVPSPPLSEGIRSTAAQWQQGQPDVARRTNHDRFTSRINGLLNLNPFFLLNGAISRTASRLDTRSSASASRRVREPQVE